MAKLWAVIKREYLESVRNKWFVITSLLVPVLMAAAFIGPAYLASKSQASSNTSSVVVLDATGTPLGVHVMQALLADTSAGRPADVRIEDHVRIVPAGGMAAAESLATADVMAKKFVGYLVLDSATMAGTQARYAGSNATSIPDVERLRSTVRQQLLVQRLSGSGFDAARVDSLSNFRLSMPAERITSRGRGGSGLAAVAVGYGLAFLMYMSIVLYGQNVMRGVMEEKTTRTAEVVVSSVKPETLMLGKIIGVGGVGLTQQIIWIGVSAYLTSMAGPLIARMGGGARGAASSAASAGVVLPTVSIPAIAAIIAFFVLGIFFFCSLYAAVGATVNSEQEARSAAVPVVFLIVPTILLAQPVLLNPTGTLAQVMTWLPFTAPIITPMRMMVVPLAWWEIAGSLLSVAIGCAVAVWIAGRIYRVGLLMYGKKPSFGELVRWVRTA